ncbi:hypothetical protein T265_08753 [Opisthorchis viverrini]|uniref:Aquaporin n=1 Tax=Opisthorchis viverrini TaxID=6198 RepID=A0A074Z807_OPIVI|nr:hypothetical protein T265_08753 [Opisthorchis viverrini]KER23341.1 hypothetical protein T265_08753 [Opisthorchis viverrini]
MRVFFESIRDIYGELLHTAFFVALFWTAVTILAFVGRRLVLFLSAPTRTSDNDRTRDTTCQTSSDSRVSGSTALESPSFLSSISGRFRFSPPMVLALFDALATMELCACSLECWPIRAVAGHHGLLAAIGMNTIRGATFTCMDAYGNPTNPWYRFLVGQSDFTWVAITWILQLLGAHAALQLAEIWWSLRPTVQHAARHQLALTLRQTPSPELPPVSAPIQSDLQVSPLFGFIVEAFGSCVEFYLAFICSCVIGWWNRRRAFPEPPSVATSCADSLTGEVENIPQSRIQFIGSFILRLCINLTITSKCLGLTGNYINPANAFIQSYGVGGVSTQTHLLVYWLGPFFGVWLAVQLQHWTVKFLEPSSLQVDSDCLFSETSSPSKQPPLNGKPCSPSTPSPDSVQYDSFCSSASIDVGPSGTSVSQRRWSKP